MEKSDNTGRKQSRRRRRGRHVGTKRGRAGDITRHIERLETRGEGKKGRGD